MVVIKLAKLALASIGLFIVVVVGLSILGSKKNSTLRTPFQTSTVLIDRSHILKSGERQYSHFVLNNESSIDLEFNTSGSEGGIELYLCKISPDDTFNTAEQIDKIIEHKAYWSMTKIQTIKKNVRLSKGQWILVYRPTFLIDSISGINVEARATLN